MKKSDFNFEGIQLLVGEATFKNDAEVKAFYKYLDEQTRDRFKELDAARRKAWMLATRRYIR